MRPAELICRRTMVSVCNVASFVRTLSMKMSVRYLGRKASHHLNTCHPLVDCDLVFPCKVVYMLYQARHHLPYPRRSLRPVVLMTFLVKLGSNLWVDASLSVCFVVPFVCSLLVPFVLSAATEVSTGVSVRGSGGSAMMLET
jgi:hypothetical protein